MFERSIDGKVILNIQCMCLDECLEAKKQFGDIFLTGITAKAFSDIEDGIDCIRRLQNAGIRVSAGLGDGEAFQWERALNLALMTDCEHLNQVFPAAALSQRLIREKENRTIVNALIRPTGRVGYVSIGTGPLSEKEESIVPIRAAAAMLKETHVSSLKFFPIKGTAHLAELETVAKAAAEFDMMIEPTGGITPDNVEAVVRTCMEAGAVHIMPHLYASLKDESGMLELYKMERAVEAIRRALR